MTSRGFSMWLLAALTAIPTFAQTVRFKLERVAVIDQPVDLRSAPGEMDYIYVATRVVSGTDGDAQITAINLRTGERSIFLSLTGAVSMGAEQGLVSFVFHPDFAINRWFYINYTDRDGDNRIVRYTAISPAAADPASATPVLTIRQPLPNHNAHWMDFGPNDGMLYIASGDGGGSNDPGNRAQDITDQFQGKILRIDVGDGLDDFPDDPNRNYAIPRDNPFVGLVGDDEIWAYGLRNPWRNAFDPATGDFYIADVGQEVREEINFEPAGSSGGVNYGWRCWEGSIRSGVNPCDDPEGQRPIHEYTHGGTPFRCSITGGVVYRGCAMPELRGRYFFADYCAGFVSSFRYNGASVLDLQSHGKLRDEQGNTADWIVSFGVDSFGEMYLCDIWDGEVFKILPEVSPPDCNNNGIPDECELAHQLADDFDGGPVGQKLDGAVLFAANCASCHRSDGTGAFGPNIRNRSRTDIKRKLTPPSTHPGGDFFDLAPGEYADLEAYLADRGSRGRPDGIIDSCQLLFDCDNDGISDGKALELGDALDLDYNGLPDGCDPSSRLRPTLGPDGALTANYIAEDGRLFVYSFDPTLGSWFVHEIDQFGIASSGSSAFVPFFDAHTGTNFAALSSAEGTTLIRTEFGDSSARNLTAELPDSTAIQSQPVVLQTVDQITLVAGFDFAGDFVMYWQTGLLDADGNEIWNYSNLYEDHVRPQGITPPALVGELVSFVTEWNALTFAGLDENGDVWAIWWAPGLPLWTMSNLSDATGAGPIADGLTAFVTPWGGINIAGLSPDGEVVVTWWVPDAESTWRTSNLSAMIDHPGLRRGELSAYVTPWGALNLAGLDDDGHLAVYWWAPGLSEWVVSPLSSLIPNAPLPARAVSGLAAPSGMMSIFAYSTQNSPVRYWWEPGGEWRAEDLSEVATPR